MRYSTLALLLMAAAVAPALAQETSPVAQRWDSVVTRLPPDPLGAARILNRTYRRSGIPLLYWPRKDISDSALQGLDIGDGPCGVVALVQSAIIPPPDRRLEGKVVVEIDSTGGTLRRWAVPSNSLPVMLRGDVLVIYLAARDRIDLGLAIREDGHYTVVPAERASGAGPVDCPANRLFPKSAYARCLQLPDRNRGRRILAYQAPCT